MGGWVGSRAVLDAVEKRKIPSPRWESNPKTLIVQPVAQCYTDEGKYRHRVYKVCGCICMYFNKQYFLT
jgi:hypothetical protein